MAATFGFDDELSRLVESTYLTADVVEQRHTLLSRLRLEPGDRVLDVGCGPGLLACEMAAAVGAAGSVVGIDPSEAMLSLASGRAPQPGAGAVSFRAGEATALQFADRSFDVVTATQVYEYVRDLPSALGQAGRVLRAGGRLCVLDTDWGSVVWHASDPERMARVLIAWDEHLVHPHLPRRLTGLLTGAGFEVVHRSTMPLFNAGYAADTVSAGIMHLVHGFVPGHAGVTAAEADAWRDDLVSLGPDYFFSVNRYLFVAVKPSQPMGSRA